MKTKNKKTTPSVVPTPTTAPAPAGGCTLGLDLGDRSHYVCVLDAAGQSLHEGPILNDRAALTLLLTNYPAAVVAPSQCVPASLRDHLPFAARPMPPVRHVFRVRPPWAGLNTHFPKEFEAFALLLTRELPMRKVATAVGERTAAVQNLADMRQVGNHTRAPNVRHCKSTDHEPPEYTFACHCGDNYRRCHPHRATSRANAFADRVD